MTEALKRQLTGEVVSSAPNKTAVILIKRKVQHWLLKKYIIKSSKIHAHDENNECNVGDLVTIEECRPYSKMKSWKLLNIVKKAVI